MRCKVKKFLCCISLETGGLIVGWFNVVFSFSAVLTIIVLLIASVAGHENDQINQNQRVIGGFVSLVVSYSIFIVNYLIILIASVMLIRGTSRRDHTKMVLFMIIMAIGVFLQFLQVLTAGWTTLISAIFMACLSAYFFICTYSLYDKIRSEKMGRPYV